MDRQTLSELPALVAVARAKSFTKAAAQLSVSPSALSQTVRALEQRLGLRLLVRTTRSVSVTDAGQQLLESVAPLLEQIDAEVAQVKSLKDSPAGTIRITSVEHAADTVLWPVVKALAAQYPDISFEISADYGLKDIVAEGFHAGVRLGEQVAPGMIARRISPDLQMVVVASPDYLEQHGEPKHPSDLVKHRCVNLRLPTHGGQLPWLFRNKKKEMNVRVEGRLVFNTLAPILDAVRHHLGLAYTVGDTVEHELESGELTQVLSDWTPTVPGYHLYFPDRRHHPAAFQLLLDQLSAGLR